MEKLDEWKEEMIMNGKISSHSSNLTVEERVLEERDDLILKKVRLIYHDDLINRDLEFLMIERP